MDGVGRRGRRAGSPRPTGCVIHVGSPWAGRGRTMQAAGSRFYFWPRSMASAGRAQQVPPYYGSCCVFHAGKTLHERLRGDFSRKFERRFFAIGKNTLKTCSVFLHRNVQHAVDEWWISWPASFADFTTKQRSNERRRSGDWRVQRLPSHPEMHGEGEPQAKRRVLSTDLGRFSQISDFFFCDRRESDFGEVSQVKSQTKKILTADSAD